MLNYQLSDIHLNIRVLCFLHNKQSMILNASFVQVGRFEVNLISPDTKSVVLEKNFKDISSCSQVCV